MQTPQVKEFVSDLRTEWKCLWQEKIDDKVRAEGIAKHNYSKLSVEQGTVIRATRDYKPIEFYDIVEDYLGLDAGKAAVPNKTVGGWGKFIKTNIQKPNSRAKAYIPPQKKTPKGQPQRKGGRGWKHAKLLGV
jgi:hypothetical protein